MFRGRCSESGIPLEHRDNEPVAHTFLTEVKNVVGG
jgi:hypothetical protein